MNPNDEKIYQPLEEQDRNENNEVKEEKVTPKSEKSENNGGGWAKLAIGGVTGIFMGAGAMYAGKPYVDDATEGWKESLHTWAKENGWEDKIPEWLKPNPDEPQIADGGKTKPTGGEGVDSGIESRGTTTTTETAQTPHDTQTEPHFTQTSFVPDELHVATVNQNLSFADAYAQARAEVGPGGVFHWHGGVFNTYTEAEWNAMTPADRSEFAHQVAPEVQHRLNFSEDMATQTNSESTVDKTVIDTSIGETEDADVVLVNDSEPDVQILGVNQTVTEDGSVVNLGYGSVDGDSVVLVDMDSPGGNGPDGIFETRVSDYNHDGELEVVDISDFGITVDAWAGQSIADGNSVDGTYNPEPDIPLQDGIASNEPDYMNDADTSDLYNA